MKVEYRLASKYQARLLFERFFPRSRFPEASGHADSPDSPTTAAAEGSTVDLAACFADAIPDHRLSTAELQGYLLSRKMNPVDAVKDVHEWVQRECAEKEKKACSEEKKRHARAAREWARKATLHPGFPGIAGNGFSGTLPTPNGSASAPLHHPSSSGSTS